MFRGTVNKDVILKFIAMPTVEVVLRLLLAGALGAAIGVERELRQKPAGLHTNILIALGSGRC